MSKSKSKPFISTPWIFPVIVVSFLLIGLFTFRRSVEINVVSSPDQLPPTNTCPPTPYSFRVSSNCGNNLFRRAAYRCSKPSIDFGTETTILGGGATCQSLSDWYQKVKDLCRTQANCPISSPTPSMSPIPPILRSCPPTPTCRPWEQMITGDPIDPNSDTTNTCPAYRCINKAD